VCTAFLEVVITKIKLLLHHVMLSVLTVYILTVSITS